MKFILLKKKSIILICVILAALLAISAAVTTIILLKKTAENTPADTSSDLQDLTKNPEKLIVTSPQSKEFDTTDSVLTFTGRSDPNFPLTINGEEIERLKDGSFAAERTLSEGKNTFTLKHKDETRVYTVTYNYVIMKNCLPNTEQIYKAGAKVGISVLARPDSEVSATFNGKTVKLAPKAMDPKAQTEFISYCGSIELPFDTKKETNLGEIEFTAKLDGMINTLSSPDIICGIDQTQSGTDYIAEIVAFSAETFDGDTTDDYSNPTHNYLPQGTLDYCERGIVYDTESENTYLNLRCGRRVYTDKQNVPDVARAIVSKQYEGSLPDHNEIDFYSFDISGKHTVIKFDTLWKAPFLLNILPQEYTNPAVQDFTVNNTTYEYVDIEFLYTTAFNGDITVPNDNPLFSRAQIIRNSNSYTLRLYLKTKGVFCGWDASYDQNGRLTFSFLNPTKISLSNNVYQTDLTGIKILIDVGHGGIDSGAPGLRPYTNPEAERNLNLAQYLKGELEYMGATVVMTRYDDTSVSSDRRCEILKEEAPDLCIAIHHDSNANPTANGFGSFYSTPFSSQAANFIQQRTINYNVYKKIWPVRWHYFYVARMTTCPVVLTENGFISGYTDFGGIVDGYSNAMKAVAIADGVADYFRELNGYGPIPYGQ